jgi:hypothetical protein
MPLFAYNITGAPVTLAAGTPTIILPGCVAPPARGPAYNVTSELRPDLAVDPVNGKAGGVGFSGFTALQAQLTANQIELEWTSDAEYLTTGLVIGGPAPGPHPLVGLPHTASGLTSTHVLRATSPTAFAFGQPQHADLGGVSANQHHNQSHVLSGGDHTEAGLTIGNVLVATGATTFGWGLVPTPVYSDVTRPAANTVPAGTQIFNTDEGANGAPNWSNGTSWVDAVGNLT